MRPYETYIGILPDSNLATIQSDRISCPLGQLVIASYARKRNQNLNAVVFNGLRTSNTLMLKRIEDEVNQGKKVAVGLTLNAGNHENAFELAKTAHEYGADVYIGGTETTMCGKNILQARDYIKAAVMAAGERVMHQILRGKSLKNIPNIAYKEGDNILETQKDKDWSKLDFRKIQVDYQLLFDLESHEGVTYLYGNDCQFARNRCYFCGRQSLGRGYRNTEQLYRELLSVHNIGITTFFNSMDNVGVNPRKFRLLAESKPMELRLDIHKLFLNSENVTPKTIEYLKRMNAIAAVGLENFALIDKVEKGNTTIYTNLNALRQLRDARIPVALSMVLGLPGESKLTLEENMEWIEFIFRDFGDIIDQFLISPLMITTGSKAYYDLLHLPDMKKKYKESQLPFATLEMSKDYFEKFCNVSREQTLEQIISLNQRIKKYLPSVILSSHQQYKEIQIKGIKRNSSAMP